MPQAVRRCSNLPGGFTGSVSATSQNNNQIRWYLVHVPSGQERSICAQVRELIPAPLLQDAFVIQKEFWFKRGGAWSIQTKPLHHEYFYVATADPAALDRELAKLSFYVRIAGSMEHTYQPMDPAAQAWFEQLMDADHVVRNSVAKIEHGELHIEQGPLVGHERSVRKIDRRKRWCVVDAGAADAPFREVLPLDVPVKN